MGSKNEMCCNCVSTAHNGQTYTTSEFTRCSIAHFMGCFQLDGEKRRFVVDINFVPFKKNHNEHLFSSLTKRRIFM